MENLIDFLLNERKVFVFRFLKIVDKKREIRERVFVGMKKKTEGQYEGQYNNNRTSRRTLGRKNQK